MTQQTTRRRRPPTAASRAAARHDSARPAYPRRKRRRRHPYAHLVKPALIALAVLVFLVLAIVDLCSFKIVADTDRDNFLSAAAAKEYGLIDEVIEKRK